MEAAAVGVLGIALGGPWSVSRGPGGCCADLAGGPGNGLCNLMSVLKKTFLGVGFPNFWPLELGIQHFGPQIRILRKISA